jgi:hypothetical protein
LRAQPLHCLNQRRTIGGSPPILRYEAKAIEVAT